MGISVNGEAALLTLVCQPFENVSVNTRYGEYSRRRPSGFIVVRVEDTGWNAPEHLPSFSNVLAS